MKFKTILKLLSVFVLIFLILFAFYGNEFYDFSFGKKNYNFSLNQEEMQFYPNLRYSDSKISYSIENCSLQKKADMENAFLILSNLTQLSFHTRENSEIRVYCENSVKTQENLFIAGEGGPVNITRAGNFNVISQGKILLLKESDCQKPNVALHELLHALGFAHSFNKRNIMYNISNCNQQIGEDLIQEINEIYSESSLPDISIQGDSFSYTDKYLNISFKVSNDGLSNSNSFFVRVYNGNQEIKEYPVASLKPGHGNIITMSNIYLEKIEKIKLKVDYPSQEIRVDNNEVYLN